MTSLDAWRCVRLRAKQGQIQNKDAATDVRDSKRTDRKVKGCCKDTNLCQIQPIKCIRIRICSTLRYSDNHVGDITSTYGPFLKIVY
ncbi:unnamed protein product [Hermetia illucens]|uniref:Uncharacterized protein n=1 Tax=Hermetia illucens TaxID=343691 RepID=A0A7R8V0F7_HERIL|nr:unnamed protein product [Hermetia illucens]